MLELSEVLMIMRTIKNQFPILSNINNDKEHIEALSLMETLIENYDDNLILIDALSNSIERYEKQNI